MATDYGAMISRDLGLPYHPRQDWGIEYADSNRVQTFMDYYRAQQPLPLPQRLDLSELILQSMNDALEEGSADPSLVATFIAFLQDTAQDYPTNIDYWQTLDSPDFPIGPLIRELGLNIELSTHDP